MPVIVQFSDACLYFLSIKIPFENITNILLNKHKTKCCNIKFNQILTNLGIYILKFAFKLSTIPINKQNISTCLFASKQNSLNRKFKLYT